MDGNKIYSQENHHFFFTRSINVDEVFHVKDDQPLNKVYTNIIYVFLASKYY